MANYRPKLPSGMLSNQPGVFEDTPDFWTAVEARARPLSSAERDRLKQICNGYYSDTAFERSVADVRVAEDQLARIKEAAETLLHALSPRSANNRLVGAARHAEWLIEKHLRQDAGLCFYLRSPPSRDEENIAVPERLRPVNAFHLANLMDSVVAGCESAQREIGTYRREKHFRAGWAWHWFVRALIAFFEDLELGRATAAKIEHGGKPSPFVLFVKAVQSHFPKDLQEHSQSVESLSVAVSNVRRKVGRRADPKTGAI